MNDFPFLYIDTLPIHPSPEVGEAFSSYVSRLSIINGIKSRGDIKKAFYLNKRVIYKYFPNDYYEDWIPEFSKWVAKPLDEILATTFYSLGHKFGPSKIHSISIQHLLTDFLSKTLRYCPLCLSSMDTKFYRLKWRLLLLKSCSIHRCRLLGNCGRCQNLLPIHDVLFNMGFCPFCHQDLSQCSFGAISELETKVALIENDFVEFLLADTNTTFDGSAFAEARKKKGLSGKEVGEKLGLSHAIIYALESPTLSEGLGRNLARCLKYCEFLDIPIKDLFV